MSILPKCRRSGTLEATIPAWVRPWARPDERVAIVDPGTGDLPNMSLGDLGPSLVIAPSNIECPQATRLHQVLALARPGPYPLQVLCPDPLDLSPFEQDPRWTVGQVRPSGRAPRRGPARITLVTRSRAFPLPTVSHPYVPESE